MKVVDVIFIFNIQARWPKICTYHTNADDFDELLHKPMKEWYVYNLCLYTTGWYKWLVPYHSAQDFFKSIHGPNIDDTGISS